CVLGGVPEETGPDAAADPSGMDPEILQPGCLAFRDQRAPADRVAARVRDEDDQLAEPLRREVPLVRPLAYLPRLVAPESLRSDRDLLQTWAFVVASGTNDDAHAERRRFNHSALR